MITPVLLCGGSGTRLWPLSRKSYPKQFVPLTGEQTLFQASALRLTGEGIAPPVILTNSDFRFIVTEQLTEIGIDPGAILIEPEGRNTAPAVLAAALWQQARDPDSLILVAPSDHVIPDAQAFRAAIQAGAEAAGAGTLITFGIQPTQPETGYGYLELAEDIPPGDPVPVMLERFVEKPDLDQATRMVQSGRFLWNAGLFLFSPAAMIAAFEAHAPDMIPPVAEALDTGRSDLGFFRLAPDPWAGAEDISIDYAVMEKARNLSVIPYQGRWSDLGGWDAVWRESGQDSDGVALKGPATALECQNTLLRAEDTGQPVVGIGLKDTIVVAMPDAVLVADAARAQEVKTAVAALKAQSAKQAEQFPKDHRPWGWFESLAIGERFQVKRIVVHPGAALSLQSHHHRSEHWIVVAGTAKVTIDGTEQLVSENQSVYIPLGAVHRMENPGKLPMVLIEVQTGGYLGEDDIIRYEDVYARD
ncbi:mannose-1-phosphate guanylyltransferase/mannose-6-phosphate isomerase [Aestuariivita sp.]|jgi:mannose-1-phosphate guanylyltransferase/mannose-1-phosphate guanylyltransferase/mannose-6-phosphate isomerase|uniref:mannose-1-phosphate guanylyltransferase/mannose-6-phosphate isomerase n=1 Tax=Aestuariivita sp. TaxID=1872407 RepID=UPI00216EEDBA|nr:mannose-1-phosphate guanylyltransferase/mannose-6-phosphate isomerase [Aestuariivita sp.]MCE8009729.1 mannose-1-phosphate guanylyltransferase/mannose-6-phosphate isomerase [Aestuariivita sp.]